MVSRYYRLPSLTALAAFEASARHRSVRRAAEELNVTPGAVSRQIKALEEWLGISLFERGARSLSLTEAGPAEGSAGPNEAPEPPEPPADQPPDPNDVPPAPAPGGAQP